MGIDWTKYAPGEFKDGQFRDLLRKYGEWEREEFWWEFFWLLQMGTSSVRSEEERAEIYRLAYDFIAEPEHWRDCLLVRDVGVRVRLIRRFPFLAFKDARLGIFRRAWRKICSRR